MNKVYIGALAVTIGVGMAGCSGTRTGAGALPPSTNTAASGAIDTRPATLRRATISSGAIKYDIAINRRITTWNGPVANPRTVSVSDSGKTTVTLAFDKTTGAYVERTDSRMLSGSKAAFDLHGHFVKSGDTDSQYFDYETYSGTDMLFGRSTFSGTDTWPSRELGVVYPLRPGSSWSSLAEDRFATDTIDYSHNSQGRRIASENLGEGDQQADGFYVGHDRWRHYASGGLEYAENFDVSGPAALSYTLRMPRFAPENWAFAQPSGQRIAVDISSSGRSAFPKGVKHVPDWYSGNGQLPTALNADELSVGSSKVHAPMGCHLNRLVNVVTERFWMLDPVAGSYATSVDRYYGWPKAGGFPACVTEEYTNTLYANGIWYVGWHNGKPYYKERGTMLEAALSPSGVMPNVPTGPASFLGAPLAAREHLLQAQSRAIGSDLAASGQ